ncbi:anti-sigma factor family protein [Fundidesulfovibrio agrisoli]|uniref:anti-sigma factor family protein n=1 Tax=Fundidesulfovibrio agrisoli TaxID=2922717 RepID=UPI001FADEDC2|nr:zf-HC2 domain-containing protein [Fundidesulfovibrio agrisoli]
MSTQDDPTAAQTEGGASTQASGQASGGCPDELALASYLDGMMPAEDRARLEEHLSGCRRCSRAVAELREILGHLEADAEAHADEARQAAERAKKLVEG